MGEERARRRLDPRRESSRSRNTIAVVGSVDESPVKLGLLLRVKPRHGQGPARVGARGLLGLAARGGGSIALFALFLALALGGAVCHGVGFL